MGDGNGGRRVGGGIAGFLPRRHIGHRLGRKLRRADRRPGGSRGRGGHFRRRVSQPRLRSNGTVVAWGDNTYGQTTFPDATIYTTVACGWLHSVALRNDGAIFARGDNGWGQTSVPAAVTNVIAVACGELHSLALRGDGTVIAWGDNTYGQTNVPADLTNVAAIACGWLHSLALQSNGTIVAWGDNFSGQTNVPAGLSNALAVAGGAAHSLSPRSGSALTAWGNNYFSQTSVPITGTNVLAVAAGGYHSLALVPASLLALNSGALTGAGFQFQVNGSSGNGPVVVYVTTNFVNWTPILTNPPAVGTIPVLDSGATNATKKFYRAQEN